jgi:hypothetical protein
MQNSRSYCSLLTKIFLGKVTLRVYVVKYHLGYMLSNILKRLLI